ncbi:MAG: UDP-N-acetylglucosamine 2-epimerase (non-hydrolyzing) [Candidatus Berkelbacteria bacterium]|nr:UDP-N-acetylglucosamine 2-epimerase (non-hydrolyzing) [Candidatus Berkelbacteria bacterium]
MKVLTILGTRPEIIRLCLIIKKLDKLCNQILVHTGQNYDVNLNEIFLKQLKVRKMDYYLGATGTFSEQIGKILTELEKIIKKEKPDRFLVLGDTNSSMGAIVAKRLGVPVYHMEAGNRCYDDRVPEEVNRRIIDHSSDVLMPYTERSRQNLLREGIQGERIYVTGNPIKEVLDYFEAEIDSSEIAKKLKVEKGKYFLATLHREENVDVPERLRKFVKAYNELTKKYRMPLIWSVHPRTRKRLLAAKIKMNKTVRPLEPLGLFDFVNLEKNAFCVLSDSGTVQEECAIFNVPNVTTRDVTERPETIEAGSNYISGCEVDSILRGVKAVIGKNYDWAPPREYLAKLVSETVIKLILGFRR